MSDPYVVVMSIDFAPWDTDVEPETRIYEFSGPDTAEAFHQSALGLVDREVEHDAMVVQVFEPEPVISFAASDTALMALRDWINE